MYNITSLERKILKGFWSQRKLQACKKSKLQTCKIKLNVYLHWRYRPKRDEPVWGHH
jgi:hypothetical protein